MTMTPYQNFIRKYLNKGNEISGFIIKKLIDDHKPTKEKTWSLYQRYLGSKEGVPILNREVPDHTKINNKILNDFIGEIITVKVGYFAGVPINYELDKTKYESKPRNMFEKAFDAFVKNNNNKYRTHFEKLQEFVIRNNLNDLDGELVKITSICGHAGREIYIDTEGQERVANLNPWETIFLTNGLGEVEYTLRYYKELDNDEEMITKAEFYDHKSISYYVEDKDKKDDKNPFFLDPEYSINPAPHIFNYCPVVKVKNNDEELSDFEKILTIVDAYDRTLSDVNSEIEQFRLAYMYFKGKEPDDEIIKRAKQTGGFYVGENGEVGFITKDMNDQAVENHLTRLESNAKRYANHVDFTDDKFQDISFVAQKFKLYALDLKCITLENKFKTALQQMMKIVCDVWRLRKIDINYLDCFTTFTRNMPTDYSSEVEVNAQLKGLVSERTRLSLLSFVDDVEYELEQMKLDNEYQPPLEPEEEYNQENLVDAR